MDLPPYQRIAADLRRRIRSGEWQPGHGLPSFRWIAERHGVGLGAARLAIQELRSEGLVEGSQRVQLWVAYPPAVRTMVNPDAPWPHGRGDGESGTRPADDELAARLQVAFGTRLHWERHELLDPGGRPAMLIATWWQAGDAREHESVRCEIRPHGLTAREADLLGLARGQQSFLVERTRVDAEGRPVQTADLVLPADRWRIGWVSARRLG